jgi:riboflavin kinase / FMN adenylyltransferase
MTRISDLNELTAGLPAVVTIGVFDGVHRGHQALISQVVARARVLGGESVVLTFHPHPRAVLRPEVPTYSLTSLNDRLRLIADMGVDTIATIEFTRDLSQLSAEEFLDLLQKHVNLRELWVGEDFALGHHRAGTVARLSELGLERNFIVHPVAAIDAEGDRISSSRTRELIAAGDVEEAARLLGRYPFISGLVVPGLQRGRTLGFPTANLALTDTYLLPANGIYAVYAELDGVRLPAVANIGVRPTFGNNDRLVEVYILDFDRSIYGQSLGVHLVKRLRAELRFASVDDLVAQMQRDVADARTVLSEGAAH